MQNITPMKRLSTTLKSIKELVDSEFKHFSLNKAESRSIPWPFQTQNKYETKGVVNDFALIFYHEKNKLDNPTFSFIFNYVDKNKPATFMAQLKQKQSNDTIISSPVMDYETFRSGLNLFIKNLTTIQKGKNFNKIIIQEFVDVFLGETSDSETLFALGQFKAVFENHELSKVVEDLTQQSEKAENDFISSENKAIQEIANIPECKEIKELRARLKVLEMTVTKQTNEIRQKHQLTEKRSKYVKIENSKKDAETKLDELKIEHLKKLPPMVKMSVQTILMKEKKEV